MSHKLKINLIIMITTLPIYLGAAYLFRDDLKYFWAVALMQWGNNIMLEFKK